MEMIKQILTDIFNILNENRLDYCIQNKYEKLPDENPSDIDMFYRNATEQDLDNIVLQICKKTKLVIVQKIATGCYQFAYVLSFLEIERGFHIQLDFYKELSNRIFPHVFQPNDFLDNKIKYKNFYIPSLKDSVNYQIIRRTMKNDMDVEHLQIVRNLFIKDSHSLSDYIIKFWGVKCGELLIQIIERLDVELYNANYNHFFNVLKKYSKKNSTLSKKIYQLKFDIFNVLPQRILNPVGMSIAILSPDGGGKSTIISYLKDSCSGSFNVETKYFRPGLFKNIGQYKPNATPESEGNPNPHGKKPNGLIKSLVRFFIYNLDFVFGYLLIVFPEKIKKKLVVFDRYYYDYFVDIYRYHYSFPKYIPRMFAFMIPDVDLIFILDAPADVLYRRKQELTVDELNRQIYEYKKISKLKKQSYIIDVDRPIEDVVKCITSKILKHKAVLTSRNLRIYDTEYINSIK